MEKENRNQCKKESRIARRHRNSRQRRKVITDTKCTKTKKVKLHSKSSFSSSSGSDNSEHDEDLTQTSFLDRNRAEAASIIQWLLSVSCLRKTRKGKCKVLAPGRVQFLSCVSAYKLKNGYADLREWASIQFWCAHPSTMSIWEALPFKLSKEEKNYVATCMKLPLTWSQRRKRDLRTPKHHADLGLFV